jgi:hypothetical protein
MRAVHGHTVVGGELVAAAARANGGEHGWLARRRRTAGVQSEAGAVRARLLASRTQRRLEPAARHVHMLHIVLHPTRGGA